MDLKDILETCTITFKQRVANLIKFGKKGRLLILKKNADLSGDYEIKEYTSPIFTIEDTDLEVQIKQALNRGAKKVIVLEYASTLASVEGVRVANPVNTLSTLGTDKTEDMKSITIVEGMKRFDTDVKYTFRTSYKGRYKNSKDDRSDGTFRGNAHR